MAGEVQVYIGLGSNLNDPVKQLQQAVSSLAKLISCHVVSVSPFYTSKPMGPQNQADYVNAVVALETSLPAEQLLDELQAIELAQGRVRLERWGARTLDLDLLLYGDQQIATERLTVPHPGMQERSFVLYPLADISPSLSIPGRGTLSALLEACPCDDLQLLDKQPSSMIDA